LLLLKKYRYFKRYSLDIQRLIGIEGFQSLGKESRRVWAIGGKTTLVKLVEEIFKKVHS
ncbi:unnamed protein product, partial [Sphenostylis stenocarpa]